MLAPTASVWNIVRGAWPSIKNAMALPVDVGFCYTSGFVLGSHCADKRLKQLFPAANGIIAAMLALVTGDHLLSGRCLLLDPLQCGWSLSR